MRRLPGRAAVAWWLLAQVCGLSPPKRIHVVVNPSGGSGAGLAVLAEVLPTFEAAGVDVSVLRTEYAGHAEVLASTVDLRDALVGIGGDGTVHELVNGMLRRSDGRTCAVGVIPSGTGNTWALDLGIPLGQPARAAEAVVGGATRRVDVMRVDASSEDRPRYSVNICACGFPAAVLEESDELRWLGLGAQYDLAGLSLIAQGRTRFRGVVEVDGGARTLDLPDYSFVQAQINARMGKRVPFAPDAEVDDGLLDLVLVKSSSGFDIILANFLARFGEHERLPCVEILQCADFSYRPSRAPPAALGSLDRVVADAKGEDASAADLNLDGELVPGGAAAFRAACLPGALEVLVPAAPPPPP